MANNNATTEVLVRPTEAQLRWAQFHHKRRAIGVRACIESLHQSPLTWEQVRGSLPDDGNSTSSCSDSIREIRKRRPRVSQGRRALLRVSRRDYVKRREVILEKGYQGMTLLENDEAEPVHNDQQKDEESDVHEDALNELFMVQSSRHRRKRRKNPNKEESFKRFQAACHAMMMNLAAPPRHSIIIPTRKWTRTVDPATALDSEYLDPKWGIRRHEAMLTTDLGARTLAPMDRGATWMMHLPKHMSKARENPYYHDPALALPPSAGSHIGSDSQKSSSTLALEAPGAQKFSRLVALVQQRMIQRQEEKLTAERRQSGKAPQMKIRQAFGTTGNEDSKETQDQIDSDFHSRPPLMEGFQLLYPLSKKERQRKSHYVPRMRLRDFVPEGTTAEEVEELERSLMDGKGIPPRMKLRGFPQTSASPPRRKSRAQELADSFEPKEKERRLSKTKELAQSFERQKPTYPKMRLRPSFEYTNGDEEEKKLSEDVERLSARGNNQAFSKSFKDSTEGGAVKELQRPTRHPHALSGPFTVNKQEDKHTIQAGMQVTNHSATEKGASQDCKITENKETEVLHDPPRRKPHPLSQQFVQAMQVSQQPPEKVHIVIKPLPPGTSCSRCTKPSPVASTQGLFFPTQGCLDTQGNQGVSGHVVAQTNNVHSEGSKTSARVHDFFSQLRQNNKHSGSTDKQDNSGERYSDYFTKVRKLNPDSDQPKSASEDVPLEETDFFAQVREMIATSDDDDETAAKRVSDFFAQVRQMTDEMGEQKDDDSCVLCEECQIEEIEDRVESASVSLSPEHRATGRVSQSTSSLYPINHGTKSENNSLKTDDDAKSEHSAISGLWNRGRTSFNSFASSLNAISETTAKAASSATSQGILSVNIIPPRVGGLLQRLQGKKDQEEGQDDGTDPNMHRLSISEMNSKLVTTGVTTPNRQAIDYNDENDLETMAAYRKSQEYKRLSSVHDDTSSHSSYHVLPDDIREVVKRQGLSPPTIVREVSTSPQTALKESTLSNENELDLRSTQRPPISNFERRETIEGNLDVDLNASALSRPTENSPSRVSFTSSALAGLSPKKYREAHNRVMHNSTLLGNLEQEIIDTDGTTSDASVPGVDPHMLASLMLSPDLLQKRLHQAVRAIEERLWDDVVYLVNANPWLAEMCELTTNQYLLHKIAFFGATASRELCKHLMEMYPPAVYKFDQDGNVPMHLAAASGHLKMIRMLGEKFESGASIRNEDGMLPLHFTIASYGEYDGEYDIEHDEDDDKASPLRVIKTVLKFFPTAVAIGDNDGNLPIHVAAECLHGGFGVDVIYLLLDEADRQLQDPQGARFHNKLKLEDIVNDDISASTIPTDGETNSTLDEKIHCNMVKNDFGETPLLAAVRCRRGWDIIEALVSGPGGRTAALYEDTEKNNVLHLLVGEYQDPAAAMSILKIVPETATKHNSDGILPIEVACLQLMPEEVILAIALVDLPFDIDDKDTIRLREEHGGSWWFLVCECDDHYVDIVQQIVMICTFHQIRELCFANSQAGQHKDTVISRATPKCKQVLKHALRFLGRFEFLGDSPLKVDSSIGLKIFDALDFADAEGNEEGRRVILKCYSLADSFTRAVAAIRDIVLDPMYYEEIAFFGDDSKEDESQQQFCIAIECPQVTLNRVVDGMSKKGGYQFDTELRRKYAAKMCAVLRLVAKAIRQLHRSGVIHGNICMDTCGKFEHSWKLLDCMGLQRIGESVNPTRLQQSFPPEVLRLEEDDLAVYDSDISPISFQTVEATPSFDIWAFGKLAYETLVGRPLVDFDPTKKLMDDVASLLEILEWDQSSMKRIFTDLLNSGVTDSCAELVTSCLFPRPEDRPASMDVILNDPFWKDMRQYRERSSPSKRSKEESTSSIFTSASSKSIFTETASAVDTSQEVETAEI